MCSRFLISKMGIIIALNFIDYWSGVNSVCKLFVPGTHCVSSP